MVFVSKKSTTLEEGLAWIIQYSKDFVAMLESNPMAIELRKSRHMERPDRYSKQLDLKNIGIKIGYWNKEMDRPQAPYLAEIQFFDGSFHYLKSG